MIEILTKYLGPTNFKGTRIKASTQWKDRNTTAIINRDHGCRIESDHRRAIMACIDKMVRAGELRRETEFYLIPLEGGNWLATNARAELFRVEPTAPTE